jgi:diguanylate cyclase (GGDEF)-like protein/PAS domain S-box-containing protein
MKPAASRWHRKKASTPAMPLSADHRLALLRELCDAADLAEVLAVVGRQIGQRGIDGHLINLIDEKKENLVCKKIVLPAGFDDYTSSFLDYRFPMQSTDANVECYRSRKPVPVTKSDRADAIDATHIRFERWKLEAMVVVPIMANPEEAMAVDPIGTAMLLRQAGQFSQADVKFLQELMALACQRMANANLYSELKKQEHHIREAAKGETDFIAFVNKVNNLDSRASVYTHLSEEFLRRFPVDMVSVWVPEDDFLVCQKTTAVDPQYIELARTLDAFYAANPYSNPKRESTVNEAFCQNSTIYIEDVMKIRHLPMAPKVRRVLDLLKPLRTTMHVPIRGQDRRPMGVLTLMSCRQVFHVGDYDRRLIETLAHFMGTVMANASMYATVGQTNDELRLEAARRVEAERHLRIYAEVIRSTGESVIITDPEGKVVEINPAYQRATGRSREDVIGKNLRLSGPDLQSKEFYRKLWRELKAEGYWTGEIMDRRDDGTLFPSWVLINAVRDEQGKPVHYVCVMRDITRLKQNEQLLEKLAFHDSLTGLPNRALFKDRLNVALAGATRQKSMLAVMYLDLDRFKYVNDSLGHAAGDRLLVEISRRIGRCLRSADTLARMGGDEFTVLLAHLGSQADAVQIAERIIEAVGKAVQLGDETAYVGASIGISYFPKDGNDAETMQMNADLAMYEAKEAGRGQYRVFSTDMHAKGHQRLSLSIEIGAALRNNEFTLVYQPMVNLATGRPEGVEALIRWQKPGGEWVAPAMFIPHAEQAGLIKKIDCWVLERACADARAWLPQDGREMAVCVNISAVSMQQPDMATLIKDILQRTGLPPSRLNLEITENAVKADPNAAQAMLEEVTSLGVSFSVNDFGTGYSSLSYLSQFPITCLKLDRQFIERIGKDEASEQVIQTLLLLARKLDLRVVAEGVEGQEQQTFLTDAGCEIMQGFHFVRPMPGEQLAQWLSADHRFAT